MIINETAARKFWPNEDPIGKHIAVGQGRFDDSAEIVGIVGDTRYGQMNELPQPDTFIPFLQSPRWSLLVFARTAVEPASLTSAIRNEVRALDKNLPVYDVKTMHERIGDATARARFSTILLGIFASIALILAAVGIYGVMAYAVTQRTREIGIRIALGAEPRNVVILVMRRAFALTVAGILIGTAAAFMATRVLESLLYEVKPGDPATFAILAAVLGMVALLASYIPARRATRVDPMVALRFE
jgi:predicted permease